MSERCADIRRTPPSSFNRDPAAGPETPTLAGDITAALTLCIVQVVNCVSVAMILRGKWPDDYFDPFFRHVTYGFIVHQLITTALTRIPGVIAPSAFENLVVFVAVQDSIRQAMDGQPVDAQVTTFLAALAVSAVIGSGLLALVSVPRLAALLGYLPDYVRHGVFAAIGIGIFNLGFESFGLDPLDATSYTSAENWLRWCPAHVLGLTLWYMDENCPSIQRLLLVGFILVVVIGCQCVRLAYGLSVHDAVQDGWLLGDVGPRGFGEYFAATYGSLDTVDWAVVTSCLPQLFVAAVLGPLLNATINCVVLEGALQITINYSQELCSQGVGLLFTGLFFGFNSYFAVADTSLMRKAGGNTARPVLIMVLLLVVVCVVPPILPILAMLIPITLPAAIFVYLGSAIAWGCAVEMRTTLAPMEYSFSLLICVFCLYTGVPQGLLITCGICAVQQLTAVKKNDVDGISSMRMDRQTSVFSRMTSQGQGVEAMNSRRQLELRSSA